MRAPLSMRPDVPPGLRSGSRPTLGSGAQGWLRGAPALTLAVLLLPVLAGLVGTLLPAFGVMPGLVGPGPNLAAWRALLAFAGFAASVQLTLATGAVATALSVAIALGAGAWLQRRAFAQRLGAWLAPWLATPHSALAIGLAFLIAPSGWLVRWVSPGLTGWTLPPDVGTVGHASGWPLVLGLLIKEVPYLLLMTLGALNQVQAGAQLNAARTLGYGAISAYFKVVLPQIYPQIRLPILAVLAFSLSVVDVALVLGPGNPPTLAVWVVRWFNDPDLRLVHQAAAAATLLLALVLASMLLWLAAERAVAAWGQRWITRGRRGDAAPLAAGAALAAVGVLALLAALSMLGMALWSVARQWRFPQAWPAPFTWEHWQRQSSQWAQPALTTLWVGTLATAIAAALCIACLENEASLRRRVSEKPRSAPLWPLYLPLLVPQVAFLFGAQVLLVRAGLDATLSAVVWSHLVFVLPYLFLSLADPWRAFDARYARSGWSLGASRWRVFWRIKLPILLQPTLIACAVAFAVSVGLYLPTLFAGSGRVATLTTEAVTLSSGADRRVIGTWAMLQALLPLLAYLGAAWLPRWAFAQRRGLG